MSEGKKPNWGLAFIVAGSWLGAFVMLFVMFNMMQSMQSMSHNIQNMDNNMQSMAGNIKTMNDNMAQMNQRMASIETHTGSMAADMVVMKKEFIEVDQHMSDMYVLMADDLDQMRQSMQYMTPAIVSMGGNINRGVSSFTSPWDYFRNMTD